MKNKPTKKIIHFERFQPIWNHAHVSACEVLFAFMNDEGFFVLLFFCSGLFLAVVLSVNTKPCTESGVNFESCVIYFT